MSRLIVWALCGIVRLVAAGLLRLLGLAGAVGLRGVRLWWLAATALGVAWAAHAVGLRAAVALALAGWLWWATRHQRARLRQRTAYRRLTRELRSHTHPPHAPHGPHAPQAHRALKSRRAGRASRSGRVAVVADALAPPRLTARQTPEQGMRALERYAVAWTRRHTHHIQPAPDPGASAAEPSEASDREGR